MEDLGVFVGFLALIGGPLGAYVIINKAIAKLIAENKAMEKQFTSLELNIGKEVERLENDYKERFEVVKDDQDKYEQQVDRTLKSIFNKMEDNKSEILAKIEGVTKEITELKIKMGS